MNETLQQAIAAIKSGDKAGGQRLLAQLLKVEPRNENAWLWMSAAVSDDTQRRFCLEKVLAINPANATARQALSRMSFPSAAPPAPPAPAAALVWPSEAPSQPLPAAQPLTWPSDVFAAPVLLSQPAALTWPDEAPVNTPPPPPPALASAPSAPLSPPMQAAPLLPTREAGAVPSLALLDDAPKRPAISWYDAWSTALLSPTVEGYQSLINHAGVNVSTPLTWIFITTLLTYIVIGVLGATLLSSQMEFLLSQIPGMDPRILAGGTALFLLIAIPLTAILMTAGQALGVAILHGMAFVLGGQGKYSQMLYASTAFTCPMSIISSIIAAIPVVNMASPLISLWLIYLELTALRAVYRLSWGRAIAALLLPGVLIFVCLCAFTFLMFPMAGPTYLGTPAP